MHHIPYRLNYSDIKLTKLMTTRAVSPSNIFARKCLRCKCKVFAMEKWCCLIRSMLRSCHFIVCIISLTKHVASHWITNLINLLYNWHECKHINKLFSVLFLLCISKLTQMKRDNIKSSIEVDVARWGHWRNSFWLYSEVILHFKCSNEVVEIVITSWLAQVIE